MSATPAYVGLGSNLQDPAAQLKSAFAELAALASTRVVVRSSLYRSAPVGYADQPDFINAVRYSALFIYNYFNFENGFFHLKQG